MATAEEIKLVMDILDQNGPHDALEHFKHARMGMIAVLKLLNESSGEITSKMICDGIHASSARIATLLQKMEARGLVVKSSTERDSRLTIVSLTKEGETKIKEFKKQFVDTIKIMIEEIGIEEIERMSKTLNRIREIMEETKPL